MAVSFDPISLSGLPAKMPSEVLKPKEAFAPEKKLTEAESRILATYLSNHKPGSVQSLR